MKNDTKMWMFIIASAVLCAGVLLYALMYISEQASQREFWDFAERSTDLDEVLSQVVDMGVLELTEFVEDEGAPSLEDLDSDSEGREPEQSESTAGEQPQEETSTAPALDPVVYYRADGTYYRSSAGEVTKISSAVGYWDYLDEPNDTYPIPHGELVRKVQISPAQDMVAYCITIIPSSGGCAYRVFDIATGEEQAVVVDGIGEEDYRAANLGDVSWDGNALMATYTTDMGVEYSVASADIRTPWRMRVAN